MDIVRAELDLEPDAEADADELDRLTRRLRAELADLDVDVRLRAGDAAPDGAKAVDEVTLGSLVLAFSVAGGVFPGIIDTLKDWLGRQAGKHRIKVTIDGDSVELERSTSGERQVLLDAFVKRHGG